MIPVAVWIALNVIAKKYPHSKIGKKFNDWKAHRALNKQQKQL